MLKNLPIKTSTLINKPNPSSPKKSNPNHKLKLFSYCLAMQMLTVFHLSKTFTIPLIRNQSFWKTHKLKWIVSNRFSPSKCSQFLTKLTSKAKFNSLHLQEISLSWLTLPSVLTLFAPFYHANQPILKVWTWTHMLKVKLSIKLVTPSWTCSEPSVFPQLLVLFNT